MRTEVPARPTILPYRKPIEGRDYWLVDDVLPNADEVRARCLAKTDWSEGYPYNPRHGQACARCPRSNEELAHWKRGCAG